MVKEQSLSVLIGKLDDLFSEFIRLRDAEPFTGIVKCFVCGAKGHWKQMQNLHLIRREKMPTRYDEVNCNAGCESCNCYDSDHALKYLHRFTEKYSEMTYLEIVLKSNRLEKFTRGELSFLVEKYQLEVKELKKRKNL